MKTAMTLLTCVILLAGQAALAQHPRPQNGDAPRDPYAGYHQPGTRTMPAMPSTGSADQLWRASETQARANAQQTRAMPALRGNMPTTARSGSDTRPTIIPNPQQQRHALASSWAGDQATQYINASTSPTSFNVTEANINGSYPLPVNGDNRYAQNTNDFLDEQHLAMNTLRQASAQRATLQRQSVSPTYHAYQRDIYQPVAYYPSRVTVPRQTYVSSGGSYFHHGTVVYDHGYAKGYRYDYPPSTLPYYYSSAWCPPVVYYQPVCYRSIGVHHYRHRPYFRSSVGFRYGSCGSSFSIRLRF